MRRLWDLLPPLVMYLLSTAMVSPHLFLSLVIHKQRFSANNVQSVWYVLKSSQVSIDTSEEFPLYPKWMILQRQDTLLIFVLQSCTCCWTNCNLGRLKISNYAQIIHFNFSNIFKAWSWKANPKIIFPGIFFKEIMLYCFFLIGKFQFWKNKPEKTLKSWISK